jgi:hypothetical protein
MSSSSRWVGASVFAGCLALALGLHAQDAAPRTEPAGDAPAPPAANGGDLFAQQGRCEDCHVDEGWERLKAPPPGAFDHASTGFPLRGAHGTVTCDGCHRRGLDGLTSSCSQCHHDPHAGLHSMSCERCHNESTWETPRNLQAHEATRFPLTGAHAVVACEACHRPRRAEPLTTTPTECEVCHARSFRKARPDHAGAGFVECGQCHTTSTFRGASNTHLSYVLDGQHTFVRCVSCHTGSTFAGLAAAGQDCNACHVSDYQRTATIGGSVPNHPASAFPTNCLSCHDNTRDTWDIASIPG